MRVWITKETDVGGHKAVAHRSKKQAKRYMAKKLRSQANERRDHFAKWGGRGSGWVDELDFSSDSPGLHIVNNKDDLIKCINDVADFTC
tara:strand:+ start:234 stop:500 length:267 start_codon:yes stop_codon:yes gene_type:complete